MDVRLKIHLLTLEKRRLESKLWETKRFVTRRLRSELEMSIEDIATLVEIKPEEVRRILDSYGME